MEKILTIRRKSREITFDDLDHENEVCVTIEEAWGGENMIIYLDKENLISLREHIDYVLGKQLTIPVVSDTLILTPKDAEIFFNEIMNHKEANDALKKAMLKFITS